ncbi:hypothetical protein M758_8G145700 [Ceratodon purpureus]|nr:hypothetical protein M758_8G145700 [Ceratodon purpureus]
MAGNLEINGEEGSGRVEVVGCVVNLGGENGVQSEQYSKEVAAEIVVVEESASSSTDIATSENDDVNKEKAIDANHKIIEAVNDQKIIDASSTVAAVASSKHGNATNTRTADKPKPVLNANAAPWSPKDLEQSRALLSQSWKLSLPSTKKLLILDVNGLLVARYSKVDRNIIPQGTKHAVVAKTFMFKRPFCGSFLNFCFENFHVGVWSSMMEANVRKSLDYICKGMQHKFMFVMHQGDCTNTGLRNPQKKKSPLFLKELAKVWSRFPHGQFNETNTLLIDDTPYKTLWNPPFTAIFPEAYWYNERDSFLKGTLTEYLKQLRDAPNVQEFVRTHPIGVPAIAPGCLDWDVYQQVLKRKLPKNSLSPPHTIPDVTSLPQTQVSSPELLLEQQRLENLSLA